MKAQYHLAAFGVERLSKEISTTWSNTLVRSMMIFVLFFRGFLPIQAQDRAPCLKNGSETASLART
jgi:hypothetical protein